MNPILESEMTVCASADPRTTSDHEGRQHLGPNWAREKGIRTKLRVASYGQADM